MRSGVSTVHQTLTAEAASILKHSLCLARRRGHAQVTPLHVAFTLLSLKTSSLTKACLNSHQSSSSPRHPLHSRALELCFNVALNRLPTTPSPLLLHHSHFPSLSNALVAALKRAQAHQRRGCIEQQVQQSLLTIKVELEQLVVSILDDPSVSRVMREAGYSSTTIKSNIEKDNNNNYYSSQSESNHPFYSPFLFFSPHKKVVPVPVPVLSSSPSKEDVKVVLDVLSRKKKRNVVIVGDSLTLNEGLVGELMRKVERGEVSHYEELKETQFIKFNHLFYSSPCLMKREEVEMNMSMLRRKVDSVVGGGKGGIFYIGDLKWMVEGSSSSRLLEGECGSGSGSGSGCNNNYNPVEHLVTEIGKIFSEEQRNEKNRNVWVVATASYQTYMRCQMRQPPLETLWALQAVPLPSSGLGLTLHASSVEDSKMSNMSQNNAYSNMVEIRKEDKLNCCEECASNYEKEAQLFKPGHNNKLLPSWLQSHTTEPHHKDEITELKKKWNRICHCLHQTKQPQNNQWNNTSYNNNHHSSNEKIYPLNSAFPNWWPNQNNSTIFPDSSSISFTDSVSKPCFSSNLVPRFRRQQSSTIDFNFRPESTTTTLDSLKGIEEGNNKEVVKVTLALGNSTFCGSGSGKTVLENNLTERKARVCKILQENVPWQSEILPSIAEALLDYDSKSVKQSSSSTWFFLQGNDSVGKTRLARAIAESVLGSADLFLHLDMKKKENSPTPFCEILNGTLEINQKLVVLVESFDFADAQFKKFVEDAFEREKFGTLCGKEGKFGKFIFMLSNDGVKSNQEENNKDFLVNLVLKISETKPLFDSSSSPCLGNKRRAELDFFSKIKNPRIEEENKKRNSSRQSSFNTLDLNMKAEEEEDEEEKNGGSSPISSDLTRETILDPMNNSNGFLDSIENKFEFNQSPSRDREKAEIFLNKIKESFGEVYGKQCLVNFSVEERVIEEIGVGCGSFTNNMFEKWLKDIFQRSLQKVKFGDGKKEKGIVFTLCWGGKGDNRGKWDSGYMGSCLPKNVQVNYFMD